MKKILFFLIFPFLTFSLISCDEEDDVTPTNLDRLAGTWEVVESDFDNRGCIYEIKTAPDRTEGTFGGYYGTITTYYFAVAGNPIFDKEYNWSSRYVENYQPLLELTLTGELDSEDPGDGCSHYKITKLTDTHMWWKDNSNGGNGIIKFRRRTDINIE